MKNIILLIVITVTCVCGNRTDAQDWGYTIRYPAVSVRMLESIETLETSLPFSSLLVLDEATWSDPLSAQYGDHDYFVVGVSNADGGTILKMDPFVIDGYGVTVVQATFTDTLTSSVYTAPLVREGLIGNTYSLDADGFINEEWLHGTLNISGQTINVMVWYWNDPTQPIVMLSWGEGSSLGNFGAIYDAYSEARVVQTSANTTLAAMVSRNNSDIKDGRYLDVNVAWSSFELQYSTNLSSTNWSTVTNAPVVIIGNEHIFYFGTNTGNRFYRAMKK